MKDKILQWFASGRVGISSKTMACIAAGLEYKGTFAPDHPHDPDDFNRCLVLVHDVPEIREQFPAIAASSPVWAAIIDRWDEIASTFVAEAGFNWCKARSAPKTYELMRSIIDGAKRKKQ